MQIKSRKAFTMLELIFVIVIIGILAVVALPQLTATRDDAFVSKVTANARTLLLDIQNYYTARGRESWKQATIDEVTAVRPQFGDCNTTVTDTTQISPNQFLLCHNDTVCLMYITTDDGNLTIANGTQHTDSVCEAIKNMPSVKAISNKTYQLAGESVSR